MAKSVKCIKVKHHSDSVHAAALFKEGKRFKCNINRVLGAVAGTVTDKAGESWTLYRNADEGYHCAIAEFE